MLAILINPFFVIDAGHHDVDTRSKSQQQGKVTKKGTNIHEYMRKKHGMIVKSK